MTNGADNMRENNTDFEFDLNAKRHILSDDELIDSIRKYADIVGNRYFSVKEYDNWIDKQGSGMTIIRRFGSWRKALGKIGINNVRARKYSPEELIDNLEQIWRQLGYPPSRRNIGKHGFEISEGPYERIWGSVRAACAALADYKMGKITEKELLHVKSSVKSSSKSRSIPLKLRWDVLKRDKYFCIKCGRRPPDVELQVDHIIPKSRGGHTSIENLQTLCFDCNQGKKNHY